MMIHYHARELIRDIERGFADVPHPGDAEIDGARCPECRERSRMIRRRDRRLIGSDELCARCLAFLRARALHYFMPCFLIPTLHVRTHQDHVSETLPNATDGLLSLFAEPGERLEPFSAEQLQLLRRWLEFMRDLAHPPRQVPDERIKVALRNVSARLAGRSSPVND